MVSFRTHIRWAAGFIETSNTRRLVLQTVAGLPTTTAVVLLYMTCKIKRRNLRKLRGGNYHTPTAGDFFGYSLDCLGIRNIPQVQLASGDMSRSVDWRQIQLSNEIHN